MADPSVQRVDLDDSRVIGIERASGSVRILLDQRRLGVTRRLVAEVSGVTSEEALYFIGRGVTATHPSPSEPLDEVEVAEVGPGFLEMQGYLRRESWFTWRITGSLVTIEESGGA